MPTAGTIIHARMLSWLAPNFYPSVCTVQSDVTGHSPTGTVTHTWTDVPDWTDLPCRIAPQSGSREMRSPEMILSQSLQVCFVPFYLEGVTVGNRVTVDGDPYNVISCDFDGENPPRMTRLTLEVIT